MGDYSSAFKGLYITLILLGCMLGACAAWIAPAVWRGLQAFWGAL